MGFVVVADATGANETSIPAGMTAAGYVTGSDGVPWTSEQFAKHPGAIRIDQTPAAGIWDATADVDDFENGAVLSSELAPRAKLRLASFANATRPGQREPMVYMSASKVTEAVNALISGGVTSGVHLWVADWDLTQPEAIAEVMAASGPFPIAGAQYHNGTFDLSIFDTGWLANVSGKTPMHGSSTGLQGGWRFCARCSGLVHVTGAGHCAAGGVHDVSESHNYTLSWDDRVSAP